MSEYVVMKLVSGETLIANLLNQTPDGVHVLNPLQVKLIPVSNEEGEYGETAISSKYCQFTEEVDFTFNAKDIIYCKPLNSKMIPLYTKLIESFSKEEKEEHKANLELESLINKVFNGNIH